MDRVPGAFILRRDRAVTSWNDEAAGFLAGGWNLSAAGGCNRDVQALALMVEAPAELDEVTLRRAQRGDAAAFRTLVERYHGPVRAVVWRLLDPGGGGARVEDLVQETFLRVHRGLVGFDPAGPASLTTWVLTIATRAALNELRRARPALVPIEDTPLAAPERADAELRRRRLGEALRRALGALSPDARAVVVLREYHEMEYAEIGDVLGLDVGTVKSRLSRARAALRVALEEYVDE
jgi:RNA polymerase sigma-70 factor (ECF subfamily)